MADQFKETIKKYNKAVKDYSKHTDTIFSSKFSELLGDENPAILQAKAIKLDRKKKAASDKLTPLQLEQDRLTTRLPIIQQQNTAFTNLSDADDSLRDYLTHKTESNQNTINQLQNSIETRDKTIYTNNDDSYNKNKLIKTLLIVLLLVVVLSTLSLLYFFNLISERITLGIAIISTVVFVYKIIRTYYWSDAVSAIDDVSNTVSASMRVLLDQDACPVCDNTNYCSKKMGTDPVTYCSENPNDICCQTGDFCSAFKRTYKAKSGQEFCSDPSAASKYPKQYYTCCEHNWPTNVAIMDDNTDMNLL